MEVAVAAPETSPLPLVIVESSLEDEPHELAFFAATPADGHEANEPEDLPSDPSEADLRRARKLSPVAQARRARLSRYVAWAVGVAALVLVAGLVSRAARTPEQSAKPQSVAARAV